MQISATIANSLNELATVVQTNDSVKEISISSKPNGFGSSVNGGELLLLSLATCFCNDIYRETAKRNITIHSVEVTASAQFDAEGEAGTNFHYKTNIVADASPEEIRALIEHTDKVTEIHNTLRNGVVIQLS